MIQPVSRCRATGAGFAAICRSGGEHPTARVARPVMKRSDLSVGRSTRPNPTRASIPDVRSLGREQAAVQDEVREGWEERGDREVVGEDELDGERVVGPADETHGAGAGDLSRVHEGRPGAVAEERYR